MGLLEQSKRAKEGQPLRVPSCFVSQELSSSGENSVGGRRRRLFGNARREVGTADTTQKKKSGGRPLFLRPIKLLASISSAAGFQQQQQQARGGANLAERNFAKKKMKERKRKESSKKMVAARAKDSEASPEGHSPFLAKVAAIPKPAYFFAAGGISGAIGKTVTAPLDRIKVLLQVKGGYSGSLVTQAANDGKFFQAMRAIFKEEGLRSFWKGNVPQVLRVLPYSALNLYGYEQFKRAFKCEEVEKWQVAKRLAAGASAGMLATVVTYPLDTIRLRMAVDSSIKSMPQAIRLLGKEQGMMAFYRGVGPAMIGVAPYMAFELASFDFLKKVFAREDLKSSPAISFVSGFVAAMMASSCTYPLDTVRRQIQLQGGSMLTMPKMVKSIVADEGALGLYRGFIPSCLKNLPNKGIRLAFYDTAKTIMSRAEEQQEREERASASGRKSGKKK